MSVADRLPTWWDEVPDAWVAMIRAVSWDHFAHLTFKGPNSAAAACRDFARFVRFLERCAQGPVDWAVSVERTHPVHHHLHALIKGTGRLRPRFLQGRWTHGHSRITVYRPNGGAAAYLTKAITPDTCDIDISGRLRPTVPHGRRQNATE